jgi:hypothetical protein
MHESFARSEIRFTGRKRGESGSAFVETDSYLGGFDRLAR